MKKGNKILKILAAIMFVVAAAATTATAQFASGTGTEVSPWIITTAQHLRNVNNYLGYAHRDKHFKLGANINLNGSASNQWTPIGRSSEGNVGFAGSFDGAGYVISGVYIDNNLDLQGLFSHTIYYDATIKNLGVVGSFIKGRSAVGGLVGEANHSTTITNCYSTANVQGNNFVGGLVGYNSGTITTSYSTGSIQGIGAENYAVGGLVGYDSGSGTITNSYSTGNVQGSENVGGLVGDRSRGTIITNCYSTGNVQGNNFVGGLVGGQRLYGTITNSYYDSQTSGRNDTGAGEPRTTAQMKQQSTYSGWNFNSIWYINQGNDYPKLRIFLHTVTFNSNGGSSVASINNITAGSAITAPTAPTRNNYTFGGWFKETALTNQWNFSTDRVSGNITLYARWNPVSYAIAYNLNGGTQASSPPASCNIASSAVMLPTPTKNGYTFVGWHSNEDLTGSPITSITAGSCTSNRTYWARWSPAPYNINYELNGGENDASNPATYTIESDPIALNEPARNGFTFTGWYSDANLSVPAETTIPTGSTNNITLYAGWLATPYQITYHLNGGINHTSNPLAYTIENAETLNSPEKNGYIFDGWHDNVDFNGNTATSISAGSTGSKEYWAKWIRIEYEIQYNNLFNGTNHPSNPLTYNFESLDITLQNLTRDGYTFTGWYSDANLSIPAETTIPTGSTGNITLYADWLAIPYQITYHLNEGTANHASNPATYTIENSASLYSPTETGYNFGGWYDNIELTGTAITEIPAGSIEDKAFYAKWTPTLYIISYILNGGAVDIANPATYTIESDHITLNEPTRAGFLFTGWYSDFNLSIPAPTTILAGSTGNITLYAGWQANDINPIIPNRENRLIGAIGVQTTSNAIILENLPANTKVEVYNLQGKQIYSANPKNPKILKIPVQTKGIYVVKIGTQTLRIAVR
ncbi:MAG: InlB B-repeat-containing protein [Fibromonadales bacterium]|nr:InlB B-repeat-containing protein [Fibromonadales bacterium]